MRYLVAEQITIAEITAVERHENEDNFNRNVWANFLPTAKLNGNDSSTKYFGGPKSKYLLMRLYADIWEILEILRTYLTPRL